MVNTDRAEQDRHRKPNSHRSFALEVNVARDKDEAINGYVMLHTTALSLDEHEVSELARQHFSDYAHAVTLLHNLIPGAVLRFLREDGLPVREDVLPEISRTIQEIWHSQSDQAPRADETSVARSR